MLELFMTAGDIKENLFKILLILLKELWNHINKNQKKFVITTLKKFVNIF